VTSKRPFNTPALLASLLAGGLLLLAATPARSAERPPNVVLIISDDQAWTDFGFLGHEVIRTPRLDRLARESCRFDRGYVPSSLCRASLMSIITGQFPHQHRITSNDPPKGTDRGLMLKYVRQAATLPKLLGKGGYQSFQSGKWWEGSYKLGGFTAGMTHGDPQRRGRHGDEGLKIGRQGLQPIFDFIAGCGEQPFFVWYAPMMPHSPHTPPARLLEYYQQRVDSPHVARYYAMCEWFDETCGQLLDYLDERKLSDNTLIVFVADNGCIQQPDTPRYAPRSKRSPYDTGLRTPILLRWPGHTKPGKHDESVLSTDLAPTILAACGVKPPPQMQGLDLLEVCRAGKSQRERIFGEVFTHDAVDIDDPAVNLQYRWCVEGPWKLIVPGPLAETNDRELYNVQADPLEAQDLASQQPDVVARLTKEIDQWWPAKSKQPTPNPSPKKTPEAPPADRP